MSGNNPFRGHLRAERRAQGCGERRYLAGRAARVGVGEPAVVRGHVGPDDPEVQVVAPPHLLDVPERLGEVVPGVEERHLDRGIDLHGEVDHHAVLERGGQHQSGAEPVGRPLDRRARRPRRRARLEVAADPVELVEVGDRRRPGRRAGPLDGPLDGRRDRCVLGRADRTHLGDGRHVAHSLSPTDDTYGPVSSKST